MQRGSQKFLPTCTNGERNMREVKYRVAIIGCGRLGQ